MTDRLYHHGAKKALQYHSRKAETYFYLFSMSTLNILPIDLEWGTNFIPYNDELDPEFSLAPENLMGVAPGDDVGNKKFWNWKAF